VEVSASNDSQNPNSNTARSVAEGAGLEVLVQLANSGALGVLQQLSEHGSLELLLEAAKAIGDAKKASAVKVLEDSEDKKIWQDKQLIYDDENAFIYRRGDTKARYYQLYIKVPNKKNKPYTKSLKTSDTARAVILAREEYKNITEKIRKGERIRSITSLELVDLYLRSLEQKITTIPRKGITPETFRIKKVLLKMWLDFIDASGLTKKSIDAILPDETENFIFWTIKQSSEAGAEKSVDYVNKAAIEVVAMYKKIALKRRYVTYEVMPDFEKYSSYQTEGIKRDVFTEEEWKELHQWMSSKWVFDHPSEKERASRAIFFHALTILFDTGMRPKELLALKWSDAADFTHEDGRVLTIKIRQENAKNAKSRIVVSNNSSNLTALYDIQNKFLGVAPCAEDHIFVNPFRSEPTPFTRQTFDSRLRKVLKESGLGEKMAKKGKKKLSLYSTRHSSITWMVEKNVPNWRISKQVGTSEKNIENIYGKPDVLRNIDQMLEAKPNTSSANTSSGLSKFYPNVDRYKDPYYVNINPEDPDSEKKSWLEFAELNDFEVRRYHHKSGCYDNGKFGFNSEDDPESGSS